MGGAFSFGRRSNSEARLSRQNSRDSRDLRPNHNNHNNNHNNNRNNNNNNNQNHSNNHNDSHNNHNNPNNNHNPRGRVQHAPPARRLLDTDVQALYTRCTGRNTDHRFRIERPFKFKGVVVCGENSFGSTEVKGLVWGEQFYEDAYEVGRVVLPTLPAFQNVATRASVCLLWVRKVLLAYMMVIDESVAEINRSMPRFRSDYHRPVAEFQEERSVVVCNLWARWGHDGDEDPDNTYRRLQFKVSAEGRVSKPKITNVKLVPIKNRNLVH